MKYTLYESYVFQKQTKFNTLWASENINELRGMILRDMGLTKRCVENDIKQTKANAVFDFKTNVDELYEIFELYIRFDKEIGDNNILIYRYSIVDETYHGDLIPMIMIPGKDEKYTTITYLFNRMEGIAKVEIENSEKEE